MVAVDFLFMSPVKKNPACNLFNMQELNIT